MVSLFVCPWGGEPQSLEPESNILSSELRAHVIILVNLCAKVVVFL